MSTPIPRLKDIKQSIAKSSNYLEILETQLEERDRLVTVLNLTPSSNDNLELVDLLDKLKKTLNYLQEDLVLYLKSASQSDELNSVITAVKSNINSFNSQLEGINHSFIDISAYQIPLKPFKIKEQQPEPKSVRFKDQTNLDEDDFRNELMGTRVFKPYTDIEPESDAATLASINQSNQDLFVQHQQTLLEQDESLDQLHDSIRTQKSMGHTINDELNDHLIILNDLERGVDDAAYRLNNAQARLKNFSTKVRENGSLVTIVILTIILILLLVVLN